MARIVAIFASHVIQCSHNFTVVAEGPEVSTLFWSGSGCQSRQVTSDDFGVQLEIYLDHVNTTT